MNPHGQRSPAGYNLWGCRELDMTQRLSTAQTAQSTASINCSYLLLILPKQLKRVSLKVFYATLQKVVKNEALTNLNPTVNNHVAQCSKDRSETLQNKLHGKRQVVYGISNGSRLEQRDTSNTTQLYLLMELRMIFKSLKNLELLYS